MWFAMQDSSLPTQSPIPYSGESGAFAWFCYFSEKPCIPDAHWNTLTVWMKNDPIQYLQLHG